MHFVLVHSPLVGPSTWAPVAAELRAAGHDVTVPDLRAAATSGRPDAVVGAVAADSPETPVLVAHSGAGVLLPLIADRVGAREATMVFVDAGLPPRGGETTASADFLHRLRELAIDGLLPKWSTWWGSDAMASLVPDEGLRDQIESEMPSVPLAFYESPFTVPESWSESTRGGFLLLSDGYQDEASHAHDLGWPVIERHGGHLDIVNDAEDVAAGIVELAGRAVWST